jgi:aspartate/methionine/tyrosine aminotransferase
VDGYHTCPESSREKLFEKLVAFAAKHEILLVNDNPYSLF